jgi:hypothetical protein
LSCIHLLHEFLHLFIVRLTLFVIWVQLQTFSDLTEIQMKRKLHYDIMCLCWSPGNLVVSQGFYRKL